MRGHLFILFFLLAVVSCSVKEDRSGCPCILSLYTSDAARKGVLAEVWNKDFVRVAGGMTEGTGLDLEVPRGELVVTACSGLSSCGVFGGVVSIPGGGEMDELLSCRAEIDCSGEVASHILFLHKQYASVCVRIVNFPEAPPYLPVRVLGNISGFDLRTGLPVPGEYSYLPPGLPDGSVEFRIPRQTDGSLVLQIAGRDLPIGEIIGRSGYDWNEADLDDIYVWLDYGKSTVKLWISDWYEFSYEESF